MLWSMKIADLPAALDAVDEVEQLLGLLERQAHRRLVEDDDVGLEVERPDDGQALALAAGQAGDVRVRRQRRRREAHRLAHQLVRDRGASRRRRRKPKRSVSGRPMKMLRQSGCCSASARSWNTVSMPSARAPWTVEAFDPLAVEQHLACVGRVDAR